MGRLENGHWIYEDVISKSSSGSFKRQEQKFRERVTEPEKDRYHLYVSFACPWAHRSLIMRKLKNLEEVISVSVVSPYMMDDGWSFLQNFPGVTSDAVFNKTFLREVYLEADPRFSGRITVPVLFDKKKNIIVNNESAEVIRILNEDFQSLSSNQTDYYPTGLRKEIDHWNEIIYEDLNNGVYKSGFATTQEAYDEAVNKVFKVLDKLEKHLEHNEYLTGKELTEADIRLFTTLVRFDPVYHVHFKCNRNYIREMENVSSYLQRLLKIDAFKDTTHFDHIKTHYYFSHRQINPYRIIPIGTEV